MRKPSSEFEWNVYRTRFLVKAKQLVEPLVFVDVLGREHCGQPGDYLVEWADGVQRIAPRRIFEDIYVRMEPEENGWPCSLRRPVSNSTPRRRAASRSQATA